jgi:hypothetical protein
MINDEQHRNHVTKIDPFLFVNKEAAPESCNKIRSLSFYSFICEQRSRNKQGLHSTILGRPSRLQQTRNVHFRWQYPYRGWRERTGAASGWLGREASAFLSFRATYSIQYHFIIQWQLSLQRTKLPPRHSTNSTLCERTTPETCRRYTNPSWTWMLWVIAGTSRKPTEWWWSRSTTKVLVHQHPQSCEDCSRSAA